MCRKITKIVATRCQILRLKCIKFDFGWGSAPDSALGAYSTPQKGREWRRGRGRKKGRRGEWKGKMGGDCPPL